MAEKMNKILHKRSVQPNELGNGPKLPDASILEYGEIAVNYGAGHEALSFKNNNDEVVSLRTDEYYQGKFNDVIGDIEATEARITDITTAIEENEEVLANAITDLDSRVKTIEENGSGGFDDENLGYQQSGFNYPVVKDDEGKLYVTVEWTDNNTTYNEATTSESGLLSKEDKVKLDAITVEGGKVTNINALTEDNLGFNQSGTNYPVMKDEDEKLYVSVEWQNTTYNPATETENGLMSSTDKSKLDSITVENGKVTNVDALTDNNLGYETANGNYGVQKDDNGLLYVAVNTEQFETLGNKSETLSEESTHNQYPTSKAVYDVIVSNERVTAAGLSNVDERVKTLEKQIVENAVDEEAVKEIITEVLSDFDETVSGNSTFVTVSVSQTDGRISSVNVSDSGIASTTITDALDGRLDVIEGTGEGSIKKAVADEATLRSQGDEALDAKITILNADASTSGSVKNTVTTEIAKIVADAPEDLNTLKEIADYIASDKTHAAEINTDISNLKSTLTGFDKDNTVGKKFEAIELSIKDVRDIFGEGFSNGNTVEKVITDNERVTAAALNSVDNRLKFIESNGIGGFGGFGDDNLGFVETDGNYAVKKDANEKLYVSVNTDAFETRANKSLELSADSTDNQYPSSKAVYNYINIIEEGTATLLNTLNGNINSLSERVTDVETNGVYNFDYESNGSNHAVKKDDQKNLYVALNDDYLEKIANKSQTLDEESTHSQYPTSKAVYDVIVANERVTAAGLSNVDERVKTLEKQIVENAVDEEAVKEIITEVLSDFDETVSGNSTFVTVSVSQTDGRISSVNVSDSGIASTTITDALDGRLDIIEGSGEGSIKKAVADEKARAEAAEKTNADAIAAEKEVREAADTQIRTDFAAADTVVREAFGAADAALKTEIETAYKAADAELKSGYEAAVKAEKDARELALSNLETAYKAADIALGTRIDNEISARETAINEVKGFVTTEATTRAEEDGKLLQSINTEVAERKAADLVLAGRLDVIQGEGEGSIKKAVADEVALREATDTALQGKIDILNGDANTTGSVKNTVASEVAKVVANAPEDLDTLKEIADYIASDKTHAAQINIDIANLKTTLTGFDTGNTVGKKFEEIESNIKDVRDIFGEGFSSGNTVEKVITDNKRVTAAGLSNIDERVKTLENVVVADAVNEERVKEIINTQLGEIDLSASGSSTFVTVTVTQTDGRISNVNVSDSGIAASSALTAEINARTSGDTALSNQITVATQNITTAYTAADEVLDGKITNLYNLINAYETRIASLEAKLAAITIEE